MKKLIAALGVFVAALVVGPALSDAGGWVVVSLDAASVFRAGEPVDVGFTVLRQGVTPETSDDLAIVLTDSTGAEHRFAAEPQGAVGHHVAAIDVPAAGGYTWRISGERVEFDLGSIEVTRPGSGDTTWTWNVAQWGGLVLAVAMGGLAGRDVIRNRRRRTTSTPAAA